MHEPTSDPRTGTGARAEGQTGQDDHPQSTSALSHDHLTTADQYDGLEIARTLAAGGVPIFLLDPARTGGRWDPEGGTNGCGYWIPKGWQQTDPDPAVLDRWADGMAVAAVMGHVLDLVDVDPRNGGTAAAVKPYLPAVQGIAGTPSGGWHAFVRSLGVRSRDDVLPGIDVKAGTPDGKGRGFAWIAPTVRRPKQGGDPQPYRWRRVPDLAKVAADRTDPAKLVALVQGQRRTGDLAGPDPVEPSPWDDLPERIGPGQRHRTVHRLASSLRGRGGWRADDAVTYVTSTVWPRIVAGAGDDGADYTLSDLEQDVRDAFDRYPDGPSTPSISHAGNAESSAISSGGGDAGDVANARRFVTAHGHRFRYFARARRWLTYADGVWTEDPDRIEARAAAEQVARDMLTEAARDPDRDRAKALAQEARRTMTARRLDAMLDVAEPHLAVRADQLDADPWLLNVANGVVDLRTGDLLEHDPSHLLTRQTRAAYQPDEDAPTWQRFLDQVQPDEQVRTFLARLAGAALVGKQLDHVLPIAYGTGANGKSTFYGALGGVLGTYAGKLDVGVLVGRTSDRGGATPELMTLRGLRLAVADEPDAGSRLKEAHVKALTGGDRVVARPLYGDPVEFDPSHLLTIVTNHQPEVSGTDDGIWRRLVLVPWTVSIPTGDQDRDLPAKLAAEADGILRWAVAGCLDWQRDGLNLPEQVRAATSQYRAAQDHVAAFLEDCCLLSATVAVPNGQLRDAYEAWCAQEGVTPLNATVFGSQLTDRGLPAGKSSGKRVRKGVGLLASLDLEDGGSP